MKIKLFIGLLLLLSGLLCANSSPFRACSGSSPNWTAATWADVASCHSSASNGDTITVTSGSSSYATTTTITKYVKIVCAVAHACDITDNTADAADFINITESTAGHTRIEGFDFIAGGGHHGNPNGVIVVQYASGGLPVLITENDYDNSPYTTGDFIIMGTYRGVIWDNSAESGVGGGSCNNQAAFVRIKNLGLTSVWTEVPYYGMDDASGDKNVYIEGNAVDNVHQGIDCDANCRVVLRHNTFINSGVLNHGVDTGDISGRYMDIGPSNTFVWDTEVRCSPDLPAGVDSLITLRGAPALIHENIIPDVNGMAWGDKNEVRFTDEKLRRSGAGTYLCWTGGYPSRQQVGWGYSTGGTQAGTTGEYQDLEPVYLWGNTGAGNYGSPTVFDYSPDECGGSSPSSSTYIQANREFYAGMAKPSYVAYTYPHPLTLFAGTTYYAAKDCSGGSSPPNCNNANNGTSRQTAELTIAACIAHLTSGDRCVIGDGTYVESITDTVPSGSSGLPTILQAENRNGAILSPTSPGAGIVFYANGDSWITLDGLDLNCGASSGDCQVVYLNGSSAGHFVFQHGTFRGGKGVLGSGIEFEDAVSDNTVTDNDVQGNGVGGVGGFAHGLYISSANNIIENNRIFDNTGYGVHIYTPSVGASNNIVRYNRVYGNGFVGGRAGMLVGSGTGNNIHSNIVVDNNGGIEIYSGCTSCLVYFNTIYNNTNSGIHVFSGVSGTVNRNNIIYSNGGTINNEGSGTTSDHNLTTDPGFSNAAIGEFHLTDGSAALPPCGVAIAGITEDFDDVPRPDPPSCGVYEVPSGVDPLDPLEEDFEDYSTGTSISGRNSGAGWTQSWQLPTGVATVENAPMGMTGRALNLDSTSDVTVRRLFTAHSGVFTICATIRSSITNPNSYGYGFNLLNASSVYQTSTYFDVSGNIVSQGATLLASFMADTNYEACLDFDTAGHPNEYRTTINGGTASSWEACASSCLSVAGIEVNSYATNAHEFWLDDITEDIGSGTLTVATPTSGQLCVSGSTCSISWGSNGLTGALTGIYYLVNDSDTPHIIASPDVSATPYSWTVNAPAGTTIKIRVTQGAVTDDSDAFTVLGTKVLFR